MKYLPPILVLFCLVTSPRVQAVAAADDGSLPDPPQAIPANTEAGPGADAASRSPDWWQRSRQGLGAAWVETRETAGRLWTRAQAAADDVWSGSRAFADGDRDPFDEVWDRAYPKLAKTLTLTERHGELPEQAWFTADQDSNRAAIADLIDEVVAILSTSGAESYRDRIQGLTREIEQAREAIADHRRRRVTAPENSAVRRTVADYDDAIAEQEANIAAYEEALAAARRGFAAELGALGIDLDDDQIDLLLSTVVGENLLELGMVFDNVEAITIQLGKLVDESGEDLAAARRYYGMYAVLLKCLDRMHEEVLEAIEGRYIPRIEDIISRTGGLVAETTALEKRSPDKAELLAANLAAQRLTIRAAGLYRDYLIEQARRVAAAREALEPDIAAAWNTYETVRVSGELVALVRTGRELLTGLLKRQVPALRPFENREMKREFEKLTLLLQREDTR